MSASAPNKNTGCVWAFFGVIALIAIIASCRPSSNVGTSDDANSSSSFPYTSFEEPKTYVLAAARKKANLRQGPDTAQVVLRQVAPNENLSVIGRATGAGSGWLVVSLDGGNVGFIKESLVTLKGEEEVAPRAQTFQTSFNCTKATEDAERLICSDRALAASDLTMAELYEPLRHSLSGNDRKRLVSEQQAWVLERNRCSGEQEAASCLSQQYQLRIINLQLFQPSETQEATSPAMEDN
ncbi:hypothetical protein ATDW_24180 [Asticcacaulis sp. DW145]|uniref:lysozyme inhibitor LprI family protein n=1 Tax=Asticcacaulis sp. DW145 TaxID=3095608 RepID=UPI003092FC2D|nr:hypothetical protein ATDW_24180 [Asticcacaulis sp. DW145]